jgi:hypothetical protein
MDAALLLLTERVPALAVPCRIHPDARRIGEATRAWARTRGLILSDPGGARQGRGCFVATRIFPEAPIPRVVLFAKWLTWLFAFDDVRDEGELGRSATAIDALYSDLLKAVRRGSARPGAGPLEAALADLWQQTAPTMGSEWRRRFITHLAWHRDGCLEEAVIRRTGSIPALRDYPPLRRRTNGPFMFDLAEPALGTEIPEALAGFRTWQTLVDGIGDLTAWCHDVASCTLDKPGGDSCNYIIVASRSLALDPLAAVGWVNDQITLRSHDVQAAAKSLPAEFARLKLDPPTVRAVSELACVLLAAPRAHLDWLLEHGSHRPEPVDGTVPTQRPSPPAAPLRNKIRQRK